MRKVEVQVIENGRTVEKKVEVQKIEVKRAPVPMAGPVAPQVDVNALIEQFLRQLRPILRAELHRAQAVCTLTKAQRREIAREAERVLKDAAKVCGESQQKMRMGQIRAGDPPPDPFKLIHEGFAGVIKAHLSPEQASRYQAEVESRAEERMRAHVHTLVAWLDQDLALSSEQRHDLVASLSSHWDEAWGPILERFPFMQGFLPAIPDRYVLPFLDKAQSDVWRSLPKGQRVFFSPLNFGNMALEDGLAEDDEPDEATDANTDRRGKE